MGDAQEKLTYAGYLRLDQILNAQQPRSGEHDEMLFIVIHQVYELWFKQLLHELAQLQRYLDGGDTTHSMRTLRRTLAILKIVVAQLDVLETMTPTQFRKFRDALGTSSGFESTQFRELEAVLGRRDFPKWAPRPEAASQPSVFDSFLRYLATQGYGATKDATKDNTQEILKQVYDDDSSAAVVAELLVDLDEGMQEWRYRHVKMVERTIGGHQGTGGSTGAKYLSSTVGKPTFPDLWAIRNLS
ncbi:MAG: tryptophan 2,3-dioxygenase [Streptosporangiaceae bacterium]|nr:tryptophan 2,3-dioxygenase [Streptosporangiaceae bacterium]